MMMMVIMGSDLSVGCLLLVGGGEAHLASGNIPVPAITPHPPGTPMLLPYDLHRQLNNSFIIMSIFINIYFVIQSAIVYCQN